jgi:hypothetical protein
MNDNGKIVYFTRLGAICIASALTAALSGCGSSAYSDSIVKPKPPVLPPLPPVKSCPCTVTVSWVAPTQNTDGSALTDLTGYQLSIWPPARQINVDIGLTTYVVTDLPTGTSYFAMRAINSQRVESVMSNTAWVILP